jgi:hypothetical protein
MNIPWSRVHCTMVSGGIGGWGDCGLLGEGWSTNGPVTEQKVGRERSDAPPLLVM